MRKKLLSALLALVMVLSCLPVNAFAAAEGQAVENIISYVSFAYTHPPVMADDWGIDANQDAFNALRNVFVVGLQKRVDPRTTDAGRTNFTVAVKGSGEYQPVKTYYYSGRASSPLSGSGAIYFEAPNGVLTSGTNTYTVKVTEGDKAEEKEITLVEIHLKANNGSDNLTSENFIAADVKGLIGDDSSGYSVFAQRDKLVVYLPTLNSGAEGGGEAGKDFVGWSASSGSNKGGTYIGTGKEDTSKTVYAAFGVKPVQDFVYTAEAPDSWGEEFPANSLTFATEVDYGAAERKPLDVYIVNKGNQSLGTRDNGKGFYTMTTSTDHFDVKFEIPATHKSNAGAVSSKYWLGAGENAEQGEIDPANAPYIILKCTPKANFPAGTYTDTLKIDNPMSRITIITLKLTVNKPTVTVTMPEITKNYGQAVSVNAEGQLQYGNTTAVAPEIDINGETVDAPTFSELGLTLANDGFGEEADVNETGYDYTVTSHNGNYDVTVNGKIKVGKTTPEGTASVTASAVKVGDKLEKSVLSGIISNPYNNKTVQGEFSWVDSQDTVVSSTANEDPGVPHTWKFTPADTTKYNEISGTVNVKVVAKTVTILHLNENTHKANVTYDGNQHQLEFYVTYNDGEEKTLQDAEVTYQYREHKGENDSHDGPDAEGGWQSAENGWPKTAGTWDIRATYAGDDTYAPAESIFHLTIEPKEIGLTYSAGTMEKVYDGTVNVDKSKVKVVLASGKVGSDVVELDDYTVAFSDANVGTKQVTVTATGLTGKDAANYKLANGGIIRFNGTITPASITIKVKDDVTLSKYYGEMSVLTTESFTAEGLAVSDSLSDIGAEFLSDGTAFDAGVGNYDITATVGSSNYTLSDSKIDGKLEVKAVTLGEENKDVALRQPPTTTPGYAGGNKDKVKINDGVVVNPYKQDMVISGKWDLIDTQNGTFGEPGTDTLHWKFEPTDKTNYIGELTGTVEVTVLAKDAVKLTVKAGTVLAFTYDGDEHLLTPDMFDVESVAADITFVYPDGKNPKDAGSYPITVTATPTGEDAEKHAEAQMTVTLTIEQAVINPPTLTFGGREGTPLDKLSGLPETMEGVKNEEIEGAFRWETSGTTVTAKDGADYIWFFDHADTNYVNPVTGTAHVEMDDDTREVEAAVYNLPENDYAVVDITTSGLEPGEKVTFYKDEACSDAVSDDAEVPSEGETFTVPLDIDALDKEAGSIYAKIGGQKTETATITYLPELGFTLPFERVTLHVGGTNANKSETVSVIFSDESYKDLAIDDAWTVAGDGANLVEIVDDDTITAGSATFHALAAGTTPITVSITFQHPDPAKSETEKITVIKELPLDITKHYVVSVETVENGSAAATPTEADEGATVTVTLKANSGYDASGLKVYKTTDGLKDTTKSVTVSGSGSSYTFKMPASDVVLVPEFTKTSAGGGSSSVGGGGSFGGGGFGGGTFVPSEPEAPTLTPEASADASGEAKAPVTSEEVESAVEEARKSGADEIVIEPQVTGSASKVAVELERESVGAIAKGSADLTVKTDAASVTLPDDSLAALAAGTGSSVTVSVEAKTDGAVDIEVAVDGKAMGSLSGGMQVELPKASGGNVLVIVGPDGSETIVKKSIVSGGSAYALLDGSCTVKVIDNIITFADVAKTDWYSDAVDFAGSHELFKGVSENSFAPNTAMTRGMVATVLWRFESGEAVDAKGSFADVAESEWYAEGVAWASEHKIINGYNPNTFAPDDNVTREQLATMLYRYATDIGLDVSAGGSLRKFSDSGSVSSYAKEALEWAVGAGLIRGNTDNTINPAGGAKRAEVATIFMRFCEMITITK